jgi:signal transduction histidine kinase
LPDEAAPDIGMDGLMGLVVGGPAPGRVAGGRREQVLAAVLCATVAALLAFDLQSFGSSQNGSPTAIVIPIALVAGWTLRPHWAAPVWVLCAVAWVVAVGTRSLLPINGAAVGVGAVFAAILGSAGGTAYRASQVTVDRQVTLIGRASGLLSGPLNLTTALDEVLQMTADAFAPPNDGGAVGAALLALEDGRARLASWAGRHVDPVAGFERSANAALAELLRGGSMVIRRAGGRTCLARVDASGSPWGVLAVERPRGQPFSRRELGLLRAIADLVGALIVLDRELRRIDEAARHLHTAVEAARDVGFETELDQVTRRLLERSAQAIGADRGSIGRIDGDQLIIEAEWPDAGEPRLAARSLSLAGVPGLLETLRSGDNFQHSTTDVGGALTRHGLQCPLMAGGELVGVMALSREAGGPFDDAELLSLPQLASLAALTLRSARLLVQAGALGIAKGEFLNMAAHELRTPIAIVRGYLSMMADGTLDVPESTRQVVMVLCQKTDELSDMIEQILIAAQIQSDGVQLQRHVFDLRDAIQGALQRSRSRAEHSGVELWCHALPHPVLVDAVQTSVGRILDNLVANAITYGNHLPVRLSVEVGPDVQIRVEDQGLGISPQQRARLFEPFYRVDQPEVQGRAGAGLGLAVSRQLAELSGGSLDLEWTQEGAGSTFVLRLPAAVEPVGAPEDA